MTRTGRKTLFFIIRAIVSISLIGFLLLNLGRENLPKFPTYLKSASYLFVVISVLTFAVAVMFTSMRWGKLLEVQDIRLNFMTLLRLTFIGFFFSNFLPSVVGGDVVKLYYTAKDTHKTAGTAASVILDRLLAVSALLLITVITMLFNLRIPELQGIAFFVFGFFSVFLVFVFLFFYLKKAPFLNKFFRIKLFNLGSKINNFKNALVLYRKRKDILAIAFFFSMVTQILIISVCYFVSLSINLNVSFVYFLLFVPIIQLISFIPVTISGIGTRELAFIFFFTTTVGVIGRMDAFALSVGFYFVMLITSLPGGLVYFLRGGELKKI